MSKLGKLVMVEMVKIQEPGHRLREKISEEGLEELGKSMVRVGLENAIKLRSTPSGYEIVSGHRRYLAAKDLGWDKIKAIVEDLNDEETNLRAIHENLHREDLSPIEEGRACKALVDEHGYSVKDVAKLCSKSESWVASRLALLEMPRELQEAVDCGALSVSAVRELAAITDDESREYYTEHAIKQGATAQLCSFWRGRWELEKITRGPSSSLPPDAFLHPPPAEACMPCFWCEQDTPIRAIEHLRVCVHCRDIIINAKLVMITDAAREEREKEKKQ